MKEQLQVVLNLLMAKNVDYADARVHDIVEEHISTENQKVQSMNTSRTRGYGIRVMVDGSMGFASSQDFGQMEQTALEALRIAKASKIAQKVPVMLAPKTAVVDTYATPVEIDPFSVSKKEKLGLLFGAEAEMRKAVPTLFKTIGNMDFRREEKLFMDTDGSQINQTIYESGGGIEAMAVGQREMQKRTYPNSFRGNFGTAGYEFVLGMKLVENAARIAKEAADKAESERKEREKRAADKAHRDRIIAEIVDDLENYEDAADVANAIINGDIRHVTAII